MTESDDMYAVEWLRFFADSIDGKNVTIKDGSRIAKQLRQVADEYEQRDNWIDNMRSQAGELVKKWQLEDMPSAWQRVRRSCLTMLGGE